MLIFVVKVVQNYRNRLRF